jgi:hypothetical protein
MSLTDYLDLFIYVERCHKSTEWHASWWGCEWARFNWNMLFISTNLFQIVSVHFSNLCWKLLTNDAKGEFCLDSHRTSNQLTNQLSSASKWNSLDEIGWLSEQLEETARLFQISVDFCQLSSNCCQLLPSHESFRSLRHDHETIWDPSRPSAITCHGPVPRGTPGTYKKM